MMWYSALIECFKFFWWFSVLGIILLVFVAPFFLYFFPKYMQHLFFLNFRRIPLRDYDNPASCGVASMARAFTLKGDMGRIGVWHILPAVISIRYRENGVRPSEQEIEETLSRENYTIILYAHGNSFDRTIEHRTQLYNVLSDLDYHVIAFDYRGYGDSEGAPTQDGIVNDTRLVYDYAKARAGKNLLIVWGHSMGTGVSTKLVSDLSLEKIPPHGLVLESPFNNLHDVIINHPFAIPLLWMPEYLYNATVVDPLRKVGLTMRSDDWIQNVTCPIMILHAEDDGVIPVKLGRLLNKAAQSAQREVEYHEFKAERAFAHKFIYKADELPKIVRNFLQKCRIAAHLDNPVNFAT